MSNATSSTTNGQSQTNGANTNLAPRTPTTSATVRVTGDVEVEITATTPGRTRVDVVYIDATVVTPGQYFGVLLQERFRIDVNDYARGRMASLTDATGIGRVPSFPASHLIGRRMIVESNGDGGWCKERPVQSSTSNVIASCTLAVVVALAITLKDVRDAFKKYLLIEDDMVIDAPLAARVAHDFIDAEAIALVIVGPSSSTKTEVVSALGKAAKCYEISNLTPQALVSGWRNATGNTSLLHKLKDNVLIVKDLTTMLSGRADERAKVLGQLREVLDGAYAQDYGNGEHVDWMGKISVLAACTPVIDAHHAAIAQLGTRFAYLRTSIDDATEIAKTAITSGGTSKQARAHAAQVVKGYIAQFAPVDLGSIALTDTQSDELARWAVFLATARAPVIRDSYRRDIVEAPVVEGPARAVKQLHMLAAARARLDGRTAIAPDDVTLAKRIAWDSIPSLRSGVLGAVMKHPDATVDDVETGVCAGATTPIRRALEDLHVLGLLTRDGRSNTYRYSASDKLDGIKPVVPEKPSE